jgi:hypothetical protein
MLKQLVNTFKRFDSESLKLLNRQYWQQFPSYFHTELLNKNFKRNDVEDVLFLKYIPLVLLKKAAKKEFGKKYPLYLLYRTICLYRKYKYLFLIKLFGNLKEEEKPLINTGFNFIKNMSDIELSEQAMYCITEILKD